MNVTIVGTGYVGLSTGTCFAEMGNQVACVDIDENKINNIYKGIIPIYEPGLSELVSSNIMQDRLEFYTKLEDVIDSSEIVFSAVGTPMGEDGAADLRYVLDVAHEFGRLIKSYTILVTKSTVPVGTAQKVKAAILEELAKRNVSVPFDVVSNPEFLKEGAAIDDFMNPDRIVVGVDSDKAREYMELLYSKYSDKLIVTDIASAEMIKYAANSMLATRISFMNEIANLCDKTGADVDMVAKGIGLDTRIGSKFLKAGCGYGGSCFPKDVKALIQTGKEYGVDMNVIKSVETANHNQKHVVYNKLLCELKDLKCKNIGVLGLAFKPFTDDVRESPSSVVIKMLLESGARVKAYDPEAEIKFSAYNHELLVEYCNDMATCFTNSDAIIIMTEWPEFINARWDIFKNMMAGNTVIDGRNCLNVQMMKKLGYNYVCIGKKTK